MRQVQVVIASVRPGRIGDQVAAWAVETMASTPGLAFELVDLVDWRLPLDGESAQPKQVGSEGYLQPQTRAWSRQVAGGDAFVFVTPQYNWGYPASLKNALDHLYHEWVGKPAAVVSYGHRGGVKAAAQLREVLNGLHMRAVATMPALVIKGAPMDPYGRLLDPAQTFAAAAADVQRAAEEIAAALTDASHEDDATSAASR